MAISQLKEPNSTVTTKILPQELIIEILSWLPPHHLYPFKSVSKNWLNLLTTDPHFANLHYNRLIQSNTNPSILALRKKTWMRRSNVSLAIDFSSCDQSTDLEVPFHVGSLGSYKVHGIHNGLLCLSCDDDDIYVWNPFTKDYVTIPCPEFVLFSFCGYKKSSSYGFGYDQESKDYKVVSVWSESNYATSDFHSYVSVYTLGTDEWRVIDEDVPYNLTLSTGSPVVGGVLHWLTCKTGAFDECIIVAFDMKDEIFREMLPPDEVKFGDGIGELGGLLCIFCGHVEKHVEIWAMRKYGVVDSWAKQYKIGKPEVCGSFYYLEPVGIVAQSGEVIVKKNLTEIILYDPKCNSVSEPKDLGFESTEVYAFVGSIISPRVISGQACHDVDEETRTRER
ncbi:hypothetical protein ACHQM5_009410 [Ranunculus cassubicifolius]